jgi:fumarate hydratase class II
VLQSFSAALLFSDRTIETATAIWCLAVRKMVRLYEYLSFCTAKQPASRANGQTGHLPSWKLAAIAVAADDLIVGRLSDQFPLTVWQSGPGRETVPTSMRSWPTERPRYRAAQSAAAYRSIPRRT